RRAGCSQQPGAVGGAGSERRRNGVAQGRRRSTDGRQVPRTGVRGVTGVGRGQRVVIAERATGLKAGCSMPEVTSGRIIGRGLVWGALVLAAACKESNSPPTPPSGAQRLADRYPCDQGIAGDPAVVWAENFEEASVSAVPSRYHDYRNAGCMAPVPDKPSGSCGSVWMICSADGGTGATQATALD